MVKLVENLLKKVKSVTLVKIWWKTSKSCKEASKVGRKYHKCVAFTNSYRILRPFSYLNNFYSFVITNLCQLPHKNLLLLILWLCGTIKISSIYIEFMILLKSTKCRIPLVLGPCQCSYDKTRFLGSDRVYYWLLIYKCTNITITLNLN